MTTKIHTYPLIIKETYLDSFGHVNNAVYLTLFEEARWDILNKTGYGLKKIKETGLGPTILEINIKFTKELLPGDQVVIESQSLGVEKYVMKLSQKMIRNGEVCCLSVFTLGYFDIKQRKLVIPPEGFIKLIEG
jgi:acyl-CoA thioester hydrolase